MYSNSNWNRNSRYKVRRLKKNLLSQKRKEKREKEKKKYKCTNIELGQLIKSWISTRNKKAYYYTD